MAMRQVRMVSAMAALALAAAGCGLNGPAAAPIAHSPPTKPGRDASPHTRSRPADPPHASSSPGTDFAPAVAEAITAIANGTRVPIEAPANPEGCTGGANAAHACWPAAWIQAAPSSYWAHVGVCPAQESAQVPVHAVGRASCDQSMAALIAGYDFAGREYPTSAEARGAVAPPALPAPATSVPLGTGLSGAATSGGVVTWAEGDWRLSANFSACPAAAHPRQQALAAARSIVAYLHTHLLPETYGYLEAGGSCGDLSSGSTTLRWAWGRDVYSVSASGYAPLEAVRLAMAMRAPS